MVGGATALRGQPHNYLLYNELHLTSLHVGVSRRWLLKAPLGRILAQPFSPRGRPTLLSPRQAVLSRFFASLTLAAVYVCVPSAVLGQETSAATQSSGTAAEVNWIRSIQRELLPGTDRITVTLGPGSGLVHQTGQLTGPPRLYFDLALVDVEPAVRDARLAYDDGVVRSIRVGRHPRQTTRVVLDLDQMSTFTVTTLQDPVRLVVEVASPLAAAPEPGPSASTAPGAVQAPVGQAAQTSAARQFIDLQALGGPNAFCPPSLRPLADPRALFDAQADDVRSVLRQAFSTLSTAEVDALIADLFSQAQQFDGELQQYPTGTELEWMAVRPGGEPGLIGPVRWANDEPMPGFEVTARGGNQVHTFVIPTACCNLSLLRSDPIPAPPALTVELCPSCLGSQIAVSATAGQPTDRLNVTLTRPNGTTDSMSGTGAVEWQHTLDDGGDYSVSAVATNDYGESDGTTRDFQAPRLNELEESIDVRLSRDERGLTAIVTAGPELARRLIGDTVTPATAREQINQLLAEANVEIALSGSGGDAAPVTLSNAEATADGLRWEHRLGLQEPGQVTVTAAVQTGWGICETSASINIPRPDPPPCTITVQPPTRLSDGRVRVPVDMCANGEATGPFMLDILPEVGESRRVTLSACAGAVTLREPGLYSFVPIQAGVRQNACAVPVMVVPRPGKAFFPMASLFAGPERRWRVHGEPDLTAPLVGGSAGVMFPVAKHLGLFGRVGAAFNTRETSYSSLFADVGADVLFGRGFIGGGVGVWDFNNSFVDQSIFFHGGVDTPWGLGGSTVQWFVEGRLFLDMLDMIDNNYLAVTGLRMLWKGDPPPAGNAPRSR